MKSKFYRNRRGQIFSFILLLITIVMMGTSILLYLHQQERVQSALVSPLVVLEVRDNLTIFEMREKELIEDVLGKMQSSFGSDAFRVEFRGRFLEALTPEMKEFIFSDLAFAGQKLEGDYGKDSFLANIVYPESGVYFVNGKMNFMRGKIGKDMDLEPVKFAEVTFPVGFGFEFEKSYLVSRSGNGYEIEVLRF